MPKRRARGLWFAVAVAVAGLLCGALGLSVVLTGGYSVHRMDGTAMGPGLRPGDRMLADKVSAADVRRGEIYIVDSPWGLHGSPVFRVMALGGQRIACSGGRLSLNGRPLDEPADRQTDTCRRDFDVSVPPGRAFLMGDRRATADDSRLHVDDDHQGTVELAELTGDRVVWHSGSDSPALPGKLIGAAVLMVLGSLITVLGVLAAVVIASFAAARRRTPVHPAHP
ncbi:MULTISPECIES: signal peptidase I [Kitasatospora]|uniref:Signal peptidase I n=1 Tax=Kitasatospora cathayae TaxID=3004092 RepID=A0ABY7QA98_9ACTN|nr:signal peptidase I [Kitasatospora sp. HUAS 3-15]WBP89615.1 signal peptidase I [Kitasatospora sp. HUAS 3-15]